MKGKTSMTCFEQLYGIPLAKRRRMEILIALMALEIISAFSYLGFIIIPPISITTMRSGAWKRA